MSKTTKKGIEPRLRFPEFKKSGVWESKVITEFAQLYKGKGISKGDIKPNGKTPCIRYGELYTTYGDVIDQVVSRTDLPEKDLVFSEGNEVIIPSSGETKEDIAKASCVLNGGIALGGDLNIIKSKEDGRFLSYYINSPFKSKMAKIAQGDAVVHLYISQLEKLSLSIPPDKKEQQKIADCLSSLDEVITAQGEKVEALKTYKKGLLQQLFPQERQTTPTLRFPEFKKSGDWERKPLNKLLYEAKQRNRDLKYGKEHVLSVSGELGCVNQIELLGRSYAGVSVHNYHVVEVGDIVYTKSPLKRNPYGIIKENKGKAGIVSTLYAVYRPTDQCYSAFLDYYFSDDFHLNSYLQPLVKKGAKNDMKVNNAYVLTGEVPTPPTVKEQKKISDFLAALDTSITTETNFWSNLKAHKKGLLQQLFPIVESKGE